MLSIMKFLVFSALFGLLLAECDINCECPLITKLYTGNPTAYVHKNGTGCSQSLTCSSNNIVVTLLKELSTFPDIEDGWVPNLSTFFNPALPHSERPVLTVEYFSDYGMVCEDGRWFATKFPMGVNYGFGPFDPVLVNGKGYRAAIELLICG
ncbi:hypothetical protein CAEBREN_20831 [Caenorhabditis brenneri]|uniref:Wall-associated receptor kinase galacturonan-binding domain-containing protein n=1 Tax=Caenorhabditis brenneri TaxID=135651 RepID=G0NNY3_CAEBE|nr:hypothetical protein CAEBREN_20831 [Caenorhabditis brenneri]